MRDHELIDLLTRLVAIPSAAPEHGDAPSCCGEKRMVDFLDGFLSERGFTTRRVEVLAGRPNLVAEYGPAHPRKTILFEAHIDTVGVAGMKVDPFKAEIRDHRLYGRGACDDKGPMAAFLNALSPERLAGLKAAGVCIVFAGAMGEETGNVGVEQLVAAGLKADEAVVLEPTGLQIVRAHKGVIWMAIETAGIAAHGSHPRLGRSAIRDMEAVMAMLEELTDDDARRHAREDMGAPTLNIGKIQGGSALNIVPTRCRIEIDRRSLPGADHDGAVGRIRAGLARLKAEGRVLDYNTADIKIAVPFATEADAPLIHAMAEAIACTGPSPKVVCANWYCDASVLSKVCPQTIVFGPGEIGQAHTADEYIEMESLRQGCEILGRFLERQYS